ncbi:MAG: glycosyltransferase family 4 protein [Fibrobacter sp.]|nr:glycosyltransferase family 4 protein [Fibrobacter sp.]
MRVCMVAYTFYEGDNRVRRYAETLVKRGDTVDAIVLRQDGADSFAHVAGVNVYKIQRRTINERFKIEYLLKLLLFLVKSFLKLTSLHLSHRYDLIHVHSIPDFEVFSALGAKLLGARVILDIHDIVPELFASKFKVSQSSLFFRALLLIEKLSMAFSDHVIVANHIWHQRLIARSVSPHKCTVVMNYPDPAIFNVRKQATGKMERFVMIYPGTLSIHQGLETVIRAVDLLKDRIPDLEFHIYGKGTDQHYFENLVKSLDLQSRIFFKDIVPIEKLPHIIAEADLGVEPKLKRTFGNEAFSTKILEFMYVGIPVVASDTLVHTHYFDENLVKFFRSEDEKDLAECIVKLRKNKRLRDSLVVNSLKYMEQNNWEARKHTYLRLVDSLSPGH